MIRLKCLITVFAACLAVVWSPQEGVESLLFDSTQEALKSSQHQAADPLKEQLIEAEVAEIMAIRKQLGGGVSEQLKDFSVEMPNGKSGKAEVEDGEKGIVALERAFAEQLTARSRNSQGENKTLSAVKQLIRLENQRHEQNNAGADKGARNVANERVDPIATKAAMPRIEQRDSIRRAARMLEEAAAILEEAEQFGQADNIRQTAGELWRSARNQ